MTSVMVVEDEEFLQDLYREVLALRGVEVVATASNGEEAVATFRGMPKRPQIILMDHRMPVKNGLDAMREILTIDPGVQVVFLTADYSVAKQAMRDGAAGYISKPFQMDALLKAVDHVTSRLERLRAQASNA
jgi:two-component system chemotaxis response regulator CheY